MASKDTIRLSGLQVTQIGNSFVNACYLRSYLPINLGNSIVAVGCKSRDELFCQSDDSFCTCTNKVSTYYSRLL